MKLQTFIVFALLWPILSSALSNINASESIRWWCGQVPYPDTCNYYLDHELQKSIIDKNGFISLLLRVTMKHTIDSLNHIKMLGSKTINEKEKNAWSDCLELYDNVVVLLNQTLVQSSSLGYNDEQVKFCGVGTNLETCENGFFEVNVTDNILPLMANNASKLVSIVLAVNVEEPVTSQERLYQDNFPSWFSPEDKLCLGASLPPADVVVAQDGTGDFRTINDALAATSSKRTSTTGRFIIYVKTGNYTENLNININMQNIMLVGDGMANTIIMGDHSVKTVFPIFSSATVKVAGKGFIASGITFSNTAGPENNQVVALGSYAEYSVFYQCSIVGYQDTLYVHSQRQFFKECSIYGTIDFIFGDAVVVFQNCGIFARTPLPGQENAITAQGRTDPHCPTGIIIHRSHVLPSIDLAQVQGLVRTYLGRPWKEYSRTVFIKSFIDSLVDPAGWLGWNGSFALDTLYYGEYQNFGPGSFTSGRVKWPGYHIITSPGEASNFTVANFLNGQSWLPATDVPFIPGL